MLQGPTFLHSTCRQGPNNSAIWSISHFAIFLPVYQQSSVDVTSWVLSFQGKGGQGPVSCEASRGQKRNGKRSPNYEEYIKQLAGISEGSSATSSDDETGLTRLGTLQTVEPEPEPSTSSQQDEVGSRPWFHGAGPVSRAGCLHSYETLLDPFGRSFSWFNRHAWGLCMQAILETSLIHQACACAGLLVY